MDWKIRRLEAGEESSFLKFLGQWISDRPVSVHFDWLYRSNPHGDAVTWIASTKDDGQIVGCTSTFPRKMTVDGQPILGSFGGDAFVAPAFRRRGIAQSLHEFCATDMRILGIQCLYGFPVPSNFRAFLRAGALYPCDFHRFWLPLNAERIAKSLHLNPVIPIVERALNPAIKLYLNVKLFRKKKSKPNLKIVESFGSNIDALFDSVADGYGICCVRDAEYLNWRFGSHPHTNFTLVEWHDSSQLLAYAVLDLRERRCKVLDFLICSGEQIGHDIIASLAEFAINKGKWSIILNLNPAGPGAKLFRESGFRCLRHSRSLMVHTIHDPIQDKILCNADKWYLMPGDDDVG